MPEFVNVGTIAAGTGTEDVVAADLNGDGILDLVVADHSSNDVRVFLGNGVGGFTAAGSPISVTNPYGLAVGDFNGDGHVDVLASRNTSFGVAVLLGDGAGGLSLASNLLTTSSGTYRGIAVGDFNNDGRQDFVVADFNNNIFYVRLGAGNGTFGGGVALNIGGPLATRPVPPFVAVGDMNHDGALDFVASDSNNGHIQQFFGDGAGGFTVGPTIALAPGDDLEGIALADLNHDGNLDIIVADQTAGSVRVLLMDGNGGVLSSTSYAAGSHPYALALLDYNGDGELDVAVTNNIASGTVSLLPGDGAGGFGARTSIAVGVDPEAIAVGDFNGDGQPDLAVSNSNGGGAGSVTILLEPTPNGALGLAVGATFTGGGGDQEIIGKGTNAITAGPGNDEIIAKGADNTLSGGAGDDFINGSPGFDAINGNLGNDLIDGGSGGNDWLLGGQGDDSIVAHSGDNLLHGNLGNDTLQGGTGHDTMHGGQGDDVIVGGSGNTWISGDMGNDTLTGGQGADTFHTGAGMGHDVVTDFSAAQGDRVQVDAGVSWTVSQSGANTLVTLSDGTSMTLDNVTATNLPSGWIFAL
ncbi:MAG: hypothetical protein E7812_08155 [Phenylobacterium sp.]|nr:MAG: hypothetical protein E7812_08155 [Phenylobacterium sp.]